MDLSQLASNLAEIATLLKENANLKDRLEAQEQCMSDLAKQILAMRDELTGLQCTVVTDENVDKKIDGSIESVAADIEKQIEQTISNAIDDIDIDTRIDDKLDEKIDQSVESAVNDIDLSSLMDDSRFEQELREAVKHVIERMDIQIKLG